MSDSIVIAGVVATTPRAIVTSEGLAITSFRLASTQRRFDRATARWVDAGTNWYSVSAFRRLAENAATSLTKGDPVVVAGRVRVREWEGSTRSGITVEIEADALGHDLTRGCSVFRRRGPGPDNPDAAEAAIDRIEDADMAQRADPRASVEEESWAPAPLAVPF